MSSLSAQHIIWAELVCLLIYLAVMRKELSILSLSIALIFSVSVYAQDALTIQEAVTKAYTEFAPERIKDLKWIPETDEYSFRMGNGMEGKVMKGFIDDRPDELIMDQDIVGKAFQKAGFVVPEEVPDFDWIDKERLLFKFKGQFWEYNYVWKSLSKKISCTRAVSGHEYAPDHTKLAGFIGNNVYISDKLNDTIPVAISEEAGMVYGQAVSRYEFGISKGLFWSNNSMKLAFYEKDERGVSEYGFMNYVPVPASSEPVRYPMAGQTSEIVKVKVYDLKTGNTVTLETGGPDDQYLTSVDWTSDDKYVLVGHVDRSQNNFKLVRYNASNGSMDKVLFEEKDEEYVEPEQGPYILPGKKGDFLWFSERDGFNHIYHYAKDGSLIAQVTSGEHVMKKILHFDEDSRDLFVTGTGSPIESVLYRVNLDDRKMNRLTQEKGTHSVKMSSTGDYFIDTHTSLTTPRRVSIKDRKGTEVKELIDPEDPLKDRKIGSTEIYTIKADDGTDLYCRMIKPSDFDASKKYPVFIYVYNGPHVQLITDRWMGGASLWMHSLAEKGYIVFTLDGRGSNNRGLEFEQAVHGNLGILETEDQMTGVEHLKSLPYVDSDRMAIHGWSYGGFMTLNLMLRHPDVFKVGVAGGAVTDWRFYEVMYTERYMDEPKDNAAGYEATRMPVLADRLQGKLMMIHGSSDDVVVPQHCMVMLNAFINADKQVDFFMYPGHKHNVRGPDRVHLITKIVDYVEQHL